ncbi:MAG: 6-phosphogluconolactonase [bacterium]|nr:6-phosphogluconolactonase [bacterium]
MQVVFRDSVAKVQGALVDDLCSLLIDNRDKPLLLFYAGGSGLQVFPKLFDWIKSIGSMESKIWFAPNDERFDVTASNFRALQTLDCYKGFEELGVQFIDVLTHGKTLTACAYWYNEWVRAVMDQVHMGDGKVISIIGMGADGHTAGIFPYPENEIFFEGEFINTNRYVTGYDVADKNQYRERITLTVPALKVIDHYFAYVVDDAKKPALNRVLRKEGSIAATPALLWNDLNPLTVYTTISLQ